MHFGTDGWDLDGMSIRSWERFRAGLPPVFEPDVLYGYERDEDGRLVLMPLRPRGHYFAGFSGLNAAA